jgi:hypothetical protein
MIVTDTNLVGFTMVSGTWGVQLALLVASVYAYMANPNVAIPKPEDMSEQAY